MSKEVGAGGRSDIFLDSGIDDTNPLVKNLSRLLRKNLGSFMRVSAVCR